MGVAEAVALGVGALAGGVASSAMAPKTKTPKVVQSNPEADAAAAKATADEQANKAAAARKQQRQKSSLLSSGGERGNTGKTTLGS